MTTKARLAVLAIIPFVGLAIFSATLFAETDDPLEKEMQAPRAYWESIVLSDEVRAQAAQSQPDIPTVDISRMKGYDTEIVEGPDKKLKVKYNRIERAQQVVIADGPKDKIPYGHPSMILLPDGKTMFACTMWPPHKGRQRLILKSTDAGLTWKKLPKDLTPRFQGHRNYGILYHTQDKATGKGRIWCFGGWPMKRIMSEDNGETWKDMSTLPFRCTVVLNTIVRLDNGNFVGFFSSPGGRGDTKHSNIMLVESEDAGLNWTTPRPVVSSAAYSRGGPQVTQPCAFRSPDKKTICLLMCENSSTMPSMMTFSEDNGKTWSKPVFAPWGLSGHRHHVVCTEDGRLVIASRDIAPHSPTWGNYVAWVGTFDDLRNNRPGQYRIKLLHQHTDMYGAKLGDTGYGGIAQLPDGTIVAATYVVYQRQELAEGERALHSMVSARFKLAETDALAGLTKKGRRE